MGLIKNRAPSLRERGKIKIGIKGQTRKSQQGTEFQPPQKLDHFILTTMETGADGNFVPDSELMQSIAARTGQDAAKLTRIPVQLMFNEIELNFASRYACYTGRLWCSGDGETAQRMGPDNRMQAVPCTCERIERGYTGKDKCKINGNLAVLIDGAPGIGGVWRFRTTSFNSTDSLLASMAFIFRIASGKLSGLPLELVVTPKKVADPQGKQQTVYVVGLEYAGSINDLRSAGIQIAREETEARLQIETMEVQMRRMFAPSPDAVFASDDPEDVADEFYPDAQSAGHGGDAPIIVEPVDEEDEGAPAPVPGQPVADKPKRGRKPKAAPALAPEQPTATPASVPPPAPIAQAAPVLGDPF
jgi:hypothetical protein